MIAATTQGPISSAVLMMELMGRDRSFAFPMLISLLARLSDEQVAARQKLRDEPQPSLADT